MSTLDDETAFIDASCMEELGSPITYQRAGQNPLTFNAHIYYDDADVDLGAGHAIEQDITMEIRKADLATRPSTNDRISKLPLWPDRIFRPTNPTTDRSGTHWMVALKEIL